MVVGSVGEVDDGRSGPESDALDHGELDEPIECPVDGALVEARIVRPYGSDDLRRGLVVALGGHHCLDDSVTVSECVLMARTRGRVLPWRSRAEQSEIDEILERLGIAALSERHIRRVSGSQQQRVFIARAMLERPHLLLMDEPTSGVDVRTRHEVLHLLEDLHHDGLAVILTTHDLNGIASHLPHLVCLNTEVIGAGAPRDVLTPEVMERTYGARMEILEHAGMPIVVEDYTHHENGFAVDDNVVGLRRRRA